MSSVTTAALRETGTEPEERRVSRLDDLDWFGVECMCWGPVQLLLDVGYGPSVAADDGADVGGVDGLVAVWRGMLAGRDVEFLLLQSVVSPREV